MPNQSPEIDRLLWQVLSVEARTAHTQANDEMPIRRLPLPILAACSLLASGSTQAKNATEYAIDAKDYVLSPLHWSAEDWEWAAGAAASTAAAYSFDQRVRDHFADANPTGKGDPHSIRDAAPLAALTLGTLAVGFFRNDEQQKSTGMDMLEATALGSLSSFALKQAIGRARPHDTGQRADWFQGGDSFPSGHATAAFSAAEVFADSRPAGEWQWRALAYTLAAATAYARVHDSMHWTSDVVAGAALGIATGRFVAGRSGRASGEHVALSFEPLPGGGMLQFSVDPNKWTLLRR